MVKSMVNKPVEMKYFDQSLQIGAVVAGNIYNISDITRGTDVTQRIGNQVFLKEIQFRISASINANVDKAAIRYIVLVDKQGFNAPVVTDVLESGLVGTSYTDIAPYYWDYRKRFRILTDHVLNLVKFSETAYIQKRFVLPLKFNSQHIGASTTFINQVYLLIIGAETNVLDISSFQYHSRLIFTDE